MLDISELSEQHFKFSKALLPGNSHNKLDIKKVRPNGSVGRMIV